MNTSFSYNGRLEVRFDAIPSVQIRMGLKSHGFQWDPRGRCWHLARPVFLRFVRNEPITQDGFQYALAYCAQLGLSLDHAAQLRRQYDGHCNQMADASMETACGIA